MRYLFLLLLAACDLTGPPALQIPGSLLVDQPRLNALWSHLEECSGIHSILPHPDVYIAPTATIDFNGQFAEGVYYPEGRRVFLGSLYNSDDKLILHEFMHSLSGHKTHDPKYFNGSCGNLMAVNAP